MRVLVCGGTGFVGHALVPMLRHHGHSAVVLTRKSELPVRLVGQGVGILQGDLLSPSVLGLEMGDIDAMILLAAPRLFGKRLGNRRFAQLRTELTTIYSSALELANTRGCPIIIAGGTSFRTVGDQVADETWPIDRFGATSIGEGIDELVEKAVTAKSPKLVWMLAGQIYGPGGMFMTMYRMARKGRAPILGDGNNCLPRIHVDDCAAAFVAALEHVDTLATGERFIVADDVACTSRQFAEELAVLLHVPKPRPPPSFIVKVIIGKRLFESATMNCRVSNAKLKRVLGWAPRYPSFREGLQATLDAIGRGEVTP
ncbi:MAG: NAD(P)-dependent oxidoreductase [Polyangiaceae bacterium]|nr:NAD(P)-dependent oxidoreductase [Polyangiaceae bacterium]